MSTPRRLERCDGIGRKGPVHAPAHSVVRGAIGAMRGPERLVLALHYYEDLEPATIASALKKPIAEVERLLDRGKAELARRLAQRVSGAGGSGTHAA